MNSWRPVPGKHLLLLTLFVLGLAMPSCAGRPDLPPAPTPTASATPRDTPTPLPSLTPIPLQGLEGSWEDPTTSTIHTILWDGTGYRVVSSISPERGTYPVTAQSWDGTALSWTYFVLSTGVSVTFQTVSVEDGELVTSWRSTNGSAGSETLLRVPGPPETPSLPVPTAGNGEEPMPGLAGAWRDDREGNVHTIEWNGRAYHVASSVNDENGAYDVTQEYWDGSAFTWTYYVPQTDVSVTLQATSVAEDLLYLSWWSTNGNSGTDVFTREP
jgi:hypothetical protein